MLLSQLGFPAIFKPNYRINDQIIQQERTRYRGQQQAMRDALRSGNDSEALKYPGLRDLMAQVRTLQGQGILDPLEAEGGGDLNSLVGSAASQVTPR